MKPWEEFRQQGPMSQKPWEEFGDTAEAPAAKAPIPQQELSFGERIASEIDRLTGGRLGRGLEVIAPAARGVAMGAADPIVGTAQLAANLVGQGEGINRAISEKEQQAERLGMSGVGRFAGNLISPANLALASRLPVAASALRMAGEGAALGAAGGAMQPVTEGDYAGQKIGQVALGAAGGAVLAPVIGKAAQAIGNRMLRQQAAPGPMFDAGGGLTSQGRIQADALISEALQRSGADISQLSQDALEAMRLQVAKSLGAGAIPDAAALARKADFEAVGIKPLLGQITRDPATYAREKNLAGVEGVGEPLLNAFVGQRERLGEQIGALSKGAADRYQAGTQLTGALQKVDEFLGKHVSSLYRKARESSGKDLDVPLGGMAQDYAQILRDFGDRVPSGVRNNFEELGLLSGKQAKIFSVDDAERLLKVINANTSNDPATNAALSQLRNSVKNAVLSADDKGGVYATARKAAAERFALHDTIPALKDAAAGNITPDAFVQRYVIGAGTDEVRGLARIIKSYDPESAQQLRAQLGQYLEKAAFGENVAGDRAFAAERFAKAVDKLGDAKLKAFFSPDEVKQIRTLSRVGSYISAHPTAAPVNTSGTGAMLMSLLNKFSGGTLGTVGDIAGSAKRAVQRSRDVKAALAAEVPAEKIRLQPGLRLGDLLSGGAR